jgi:hypothetical protein
MPCYICKEELVTNSCAVCKREICKQHESPLDKTFCTECVGVPSDAIRHEPLIDEDGVQKTGRHIILSGEFWVRSNKIIDSMTEAELHDWLTELKDSVRETELALDFKRIHVAKVENELSLRLGRRSQRARLIKHTVEKHKQLNPKLTPKQAETGTADVLRSLKGLGLSREKMIALLAKLGGKS